MMIRALPLRAARQASRRRLPLSAECMTTTPALKRRRNRSTSCGVSAISGTSTRTCPPPASAAAMTRRYTSVLPLPVTPYSRCAANLPSVALIASTTCDCASVRVTSLGRSSNGAGFAGRLLGGNPAALRQLVEVPGFERFDQVGRRCAAALRQEREQGSLPRRALRSGSSRCRRPAAVKSNGGGFRGGLAAPQARSATPPPSLPRWDGDSTPPPSTTSRR